MASPLSDYLDGQPAPSQRMPDDRAVKEGLILSEQVRQLYSLAPVGFLATFLNSAIVFLVMKDLIPRLFLVPWLVTIVTLTTARFWLVLHFRRVPEAATAFSWRKRFLVGLVLVGATWGSIGVVPLTYSIAHQVFIAFVLGGMAAGASSTFSSTRYGYLSFALPAMLPLSLHFFLVGDQFHFAMGGMTLLYLVLLARISRHNYSINRTSLLLRFENKEMVDSLRRAKEALEGLNVQLVEEIEAKHKAEGELRAHQEHLEKVVEERTADLLRANEQLRSEIQEREHVQRELVASKEAAEAGNKAKGEFLANMSHEMRTPLAGVLGMIRLVLDMEIGDEERDLLEMARRAADSLLRIIADVLDFSRLEAGVMRFERKPFSIAEVVRAALEVVSLSAREKDLQLSWQAGSELPEEMEGDAGRVRQVLVNLLGNAVKFTERGRIEVEVSRLDAGSGSPGGFILFKVEDTGVGIASDQLERIFGMFTQVDSSLTKRYGGTGLGLALSRQIVEKLGGRLWAESRPGAGSTFFFTLPYYPTSVSA